MRLDLLASLRRRLERLPPPMVLPGAVVAPLRYHPDQERSLESLHAATGVFDAEGRFVDGAALIRHGKRLDHPGRFAPERSRPETVIYAGRLFEHFGHFLLEGLARLWCADACPGAPIAWSVPEGASPRALRPWQRELLNRLVGEREHILVDAPTRFAQVVVAAQGYVIPTRFHREHRRALERAGMDHRPEPGRRVWLSRRGHDGDRGLLNGLSLEHHLARAGWEILRPEAMTIAEQIEALAGAEQVAGEEGSALHMVVFLREARRLRLDILSRGARPAGVRGNYAVIAGAKGLRHRPHVAPTEIVIHRTVAHTTRVARDFRGHLDALGVPVGAGALAGRAPWDAEVLRLRSGLRAGARVLQLGGPAGAGLRPLPGQTAVIVSDAIGLDPRAPALEGIDVLEMAPGLALRLGLIDASAFDLILLADPRAAPAGSELQALLRPGGAVVRPDPNGGLSGD